MLHQSIFESGSATAVSLPEVVGAFSYTLDVGVGRPAGHSVRSCWIGMHVGRELDLASDDLHDLYYVLLLGNSGFGQLHVSPSVASGISAINEHWDGSGEPGRLRGEAIPVTARVALLAQIADIAHGGSRTAAAVREVKSKSGSWLDPRLVAGFERVAMSGFMWAQLNGPFLDARVAMFAPDYESDPAAPDLLGDITIDLGRMLRSKAVNRDCVAAFRRAGITGR
jgi:hypothetical protein